MFLMGDSKSQLLQSMRRLATGAATLLASIALSLLVLEAGVRIWAGVPLTWSENFVARELDAVHKQGSPGVYDARLGWTTMPNTSWNAEGKRVPVGIYTFGDYGVRMPTSHVVPLEKGAILLVGDSFGAGSEVPDADSWPAQLEPMIGSRVINATVGGYGFDQIVLRAEELLPRLEPRMLLVQTRLEFGLSVVRMSLYGGTPKPYFAVEDGRLVLQNQPVPRLASNSDDIGWARAVFGHSYLVQYVVIRLDLMQWWVSPSMATKFALSTDQAVETSCLLMQRLAQIRDREGIKVALVFQYSGADGLDSKLAWDHDRDRVLACSQREGLDVIDVLDTLRAAYRSDSVSYRRLWVMHDNDRLYGHMSAEGNRLIANLIARQLAKATALHKSRNR
jgi:hypothetical protein